MNLDLLVITLIISMGCAHTENSKPGAASSARVETAPVPSPLGFMSIFEAPSIRNPRWGSDSESLFIVSQRRPNSSEQIYEIRTLPFFIRQLTYQDGQIVDFLPLNSEDLIYLSTTDEDKEWPKRLRPVGSSPRFHTFVQKNHGEEIHRLDHEALAIRSHHQESPDQLQLRTPESVYRLTPQSPHLTLAGPATSQLRVLGWRPQFQKDSIRTSWTLENGNYWIHSLSQPVSTWTPWDQIRSIHDITINGETYFLVLGKRSAAPWALEILNWKEKCIFDQPLAVGDISDFSLAPDQKRAVLVRNRPDAKTDRLEMFEIPALMQGLCRQLRGSEPQNSVPVESVDDPTRYPRTRSNSLAPES